MPFWTIWGLLTGPIKNLCCFLGLLDQYPELSFTFVSDEILDWKEVQFLCAAYLVDLSFGNPQNAFCDTNVNTLNGCKTGCLCIVVQTRTELAV